MPDPGFLDRMRQPPITHARPEASAPGLVVGAEATLAAHR